MNQNTKKEFYREMQKSAAIPFLGALVSQVGTNAAVKHVIRNQKAGFKYGQRVIKHSLSNAPSSRMKSFGLAALGGLAPEFEMGLTAANQKLVNLATNPQYKGTRAYLRLLKDKSPEDIAQIVATPKGERQATYMAKRLQKEWGLGGAKNFADKKIPILEQLTSSNPLHRASVARGLIQIKQRSGILSNVLPGAISEAQKAVKSGTPIRIHHDRVSPMISAASIGATALIDPGTAAMSGVKRFLSSRLAERNRFTSPIQKQLQKIFVTGRSKKLYQLGVQGKAGISTGKLRGLSRAIDDYVLNPITSEIKNTSYDLGRLTHKAQKLGY